MRVLVVEDEAMLALEVAEQLEQAGFHVIGPAFSVGNALSVLEMQGCDSAVLDVHLGEQTSAPVALALTSRRIPFVALSGYGRDELPVEFRHSPLLTKPADSSHLIRALRSLSGARS